MRKLFFLKSLSFFTLFIVIVLGVITNPVFFSAQNKSDVMIFVDQERLKADVKFLTEISPARNNYNVQSLNKAADYIKNEFQKIGLKTEEQKYFTDGKEYKNIIAMIGDKDAERIVLGAHYDVCDEQPGADDNASGVAGLLELARLIKSQNIKTTYRIDFVAFSLEEPPHFREATMGSAVHAKSLHDAKVKVKGMICLEMIGYFSDEPKSQSYPVSIMKLFYPTKANFIAVVGTFWQGKIVRHVKRFMKSGSGIQICSIIAPKFIPGIDFSDHLNYWKYGYNAVMITDTAFYRNNNYHKSSDTMETLDFDKMAEVVKGVYNAVVYF